MLDPEVGQVAGDLHRAAVRRQEVQHQRRAAHPRGFGQAEEVLNPRRDPRWTVGLVVDQRAPPLRQRYVAWRELLQERPLWRFQAAEQDAATGQRADLGQTDGTCTSGLQRRFQPGLIRRWQARPLARGEIQASQLGLGALCVSKGSEASAL